MDFAKTVQDDLVSADNAVRGGRYYCPVCEAPVSLKRGYWNRAHFAHAKNSGSPECDLYHPGSAIQPHVSIAHSASTVTEQHQPEIRAPLLCVVIAGESADHFTWGLRIWFPRSKTTKGRFQFERRPGQFKHIALAQLALEDVLVSAEPGKAQYRASFFSGSVDPEYKAAAATPVDGLRADGITVFSATGRPGKLLADGLRWGSTYLFVWNSSLKLAWPEGLCPGVTSKNQGWLCGAVTLPSRPSKSVESWALDNTGLRVAPVQTGCYILPPVGVLVGSAGEVFVPHGQTARVLFSSPSQDRFAEPQLVEVISQGRSSKLETNLSPNCLIGIDIPLGTSTLRVGGEDLLEFSSRERQHAPVEEETITVTTVDAAKNDRSFSLHIGASKMAFQRVRQGSLSLASMALPNGIVGKISWRNRDEFHWHHKEIIAESNGAELGPFSTAVNQETIDLISGLLLDSSIQVNVDFDGFGGISLQTEDDQEIKLRLPTRVRERLLWLLQQSKPIIGGDIFNASQADEELVQLFQETALPSHLMAHGRAMKKQIKRIRKTN